MTFMQINWIAGEAVDGAVGMPGIFTSTLQNIFLNDQKHPIIRAANNYNSTYTSEALNSEFARGDESAIRGWLYAVSLADTYTCNLFVFDTTSFLVYAKSITSAKPIKSVFFLEINEELFTAKDTTTKINTVVGETAILITGLDKMYYIDSDFIDVDPVVKEFKIATSIVPAGTSVVDSIDAVFFQSSIGMFCASPRLTTLLPEYSKKRFLMSRAFSVDDFTVTPPGAAQEELDKNPMDLIVMSPANEEFYSLSTNETLIVAVTKTGLRVIKSSDQTDTYLSGDTADQYVGGYGNTIRAKAVAFAGFMIFATSYTLRAKMLQSLETDYVNTIDLVLPLLSNFNTKIRDLGLDYNNQNLMVFLENGDVLSIAAQSIVPSNSYNLTLPITKSYSSPNIEYLYISSLNPAWMILRNYDDAGKEFYTLASRDFDTNYYGFLLDGAQKYYWQVTVTDLAANSFTATFDTSFLATENIAGIWLLDATKWRFYATDAANYPTYTTQTTGHTIANDVTYDCIPVVLQNGYQVFPNAYAQKWAVAEVNINITGDDDGNNYIFSEFHGAPVDGFCNVNNIPTNQTYQGEMDVYIALSAPEMSIGWRDINCIDNLHNRGGIRCVMLCDSNDVGDYVDFYNGNASACLQVNEDCTEIEFQTDVGVSYTEKSVKASSKRFLTANGEKRFTRIIGQY